MSLPDLRHEQLIALDIETYDPALGAGRGPGWPYDEGFITGIAVAWRDQSFYVSLNHVDSLNHDSEKVQRWLRSFWHLPQVVFNAGYDYPWIQTDLGLNPPLHFDDVAAMIALIDENRLEYTLDSVALSYGLAGKNEVPLEEAARRLGIKPKKIKESMHRLPATAVAEYAEQDARQTLLLYHKLYPLIQVEKLESAYQLELDLLPLIMAMRRRGLRIDQNAAEQAYQHFAHLRDETLSQLSHQYGGEVDIKAVRSPGWLCSAFDRENLTYPKTAKGHPSFMAGWMKAHQHWLPNLITRAKKLDDAAEKFFKNYILSFTHKGRIHPNINSFQNEEGGTRSHRFSYSCPPLQQAPAREEEFAPVFRGAFLPEEDQVWGSLDYSQQELRLLVHYAEMLELPGVQPVGQEYRANPLADFHALGAQLTGLPRDGKAARAQGHQHNAKDVTFAKIYGAGRKQFCAMTGLTPEQAQTTIAQYDLHLPFVKQISLLTENAAKKRGFIRLIDGAMCHFPFWEPVPDWANGPPQRQPALPLKLAQEHYGPKLQRAYTYKALNRLIQGSAARQIKLAMRAAWQEGLLPLLTIHDELAFSFSSYEEALRAQRCMVEVLKLTVPMKVDMEFGRSWGDSMKKHSWEEVCP